MVYLTAAALLLLFVAPAHAYIDPGSGSFALQVALAGVLALAFSAKMFWRRLKERVVGLVSSHNGRPRREV